MFILLLVIVCLTALIAGVVTKCGMKDFYRDNPISFLDISHIIFVFIFGFVISRFVLQNFSAILAVFTLAAVFYIGGFLSGFTIANLVLSGIDKILAREN